MDEDKRVTGWFSDSGKEEQMEHRNGKPKEESGQNTAYFAYGPFKSKNVEIEVSPPKPLRSYPSADETYSIGPAGEWRYPKPQRRFSFKGFVASFLAGAVVVGSLMFFSDKMNWFTGEMSSGSPSYTAQSENGVRSGSGDVTPASLNVVRPNAIADIVEKASPAVVKIETFATQSGRQGNPFFGDDIFRYWFGDGFDAPGGSSQNRRVMLGMGSGFIFDEEGYILTNEHVINGAEEIYVTVEGFKEPFKARLLGSDFDMDLAVLKIEGKEPFPTLQLGDSSSVRVGEWLTAIGNPKGFDHTVSVGVLSAKDREISIPDRPRTRHYRNLLQTDASINPGNSGGPLLNLNGEVIGINTAVSAEAQGIGFAIPANEVARVLDQLKQNKKIPKPWIGITLVNIEESWVKDLQLDSAEGVLIQGVYENSPAEKAGLQVYDVITAVNGKKVKNSEELINIVQSSKIGDKLTLTLVRDGKKLNTVVTLEDQNAN